MIQLKEVGNVIQVNELGTDGTDVLIHCVVKGTEEDNSNPYISAFTKDGENFNLSIIRDASLVEDYEFTPLVKQEIISRAKRRINKICR